MVCMHHGKRCVASVFLSVLALLADLFIFSILRSLASANMSEKHFKVTWLEGEPIPYLDAFKLRESIPPALRDRLASAVQRVMERPEAQRFLTPVDLDVYFTVVPVPMDLGLVLRRLENVRFL